MAQGTTRLARLAIVRARWRFMSSSKLPAVCPVYTASGVPRGLGAVPVVALVCRQAR